MIMEMVNTRMVRKLNKRKLVRYIITVIAFVSVTMFFDENRTLLSALGQVLLLIGAIEFVNWGWDSKTYGKKKEEDKLNE